MRQVTLSTLLRVSLSAYVGAMADLETPGWERIEVPGTEHRNVHNHGAGTVYDPSTQSFRVRQPWEDGYVQGTFASVYVRRCPVCRALMWDSDEEQALHDQWHTLNPWTGLTKAPE